MGEAESNLVEQADNPIENPVEAAAQEAIQKRLDEQPSPAVEPKQPRYEEDDDELDDDVHDLELKAADASAQLQGHKFGSREYIAAIEDRLRPNQEDTARAGISPCDGSGKPDGAIMVVRSNDAKQDRANPRGSSLCTQRRGRS